MLSLFSLPDCEGVSCKVGGDSQEKEKSAVVALPRF